MLKATVTEQIGSRTDARGRRHTKRKQIKAGRSWRTWTAKDTKPWRLANIGGHQSAEAQRGKPPCGTVSAGTALYRTNKAAEIPRHPACGPATTAPRRIGRNRREAAAPDSKRKRPNAEAEAQQTRQRAWRHGEGATATEAGGVSERRRQETGKGGDESNRPGRDFLGSTRRRLWPESFGRRGQTITKQTPVQTWSNERSGRWPGAEVAQSENLGRRGPAACVGWRV